MKSKKLVALALTAAIAISAVSATASAASVTIKTKPAIYEQTATVKIEEKDVGKKVSDIVTELKEKTLPNTTLYKFVGWSATKIEDTTAYDTAFADDADSISSLLLEDYKFETLGFEGLGEESGDGEGEETQPGGLYDPEAGLPEATDDGEDEEDDTAKILESDVGKSVVVYPVFRRWADEDEANNAASSAASAAAKADEQSKRDAHLAAEDANHSATDNYKNNSDSSSDKKYDTKAAEVTLDTKGDNKPPYTDVEREHILKMAGVTSESNTLAFTYEVGNPSGWGLISGKNARVQLKLPDGYTTSGYKVTVYHIVDNYKKQKVTGLDVGTYDVAFWANDFSPYVLILTPTDAEKTGTSTGNPSTGDFSAVPVALLAAAALGATGVVAYKKRKAE